MRNLTFILSLLFSLDCNSQIEEFIKSYKDTSKVYAKWLTILPESEENIPTEGFYFQIGNRIEANGILAYSITDSRYERLLNETRTNIGVNKLKSNPRLDKISENRAKRIANILIDENGNLREEFVIKSNILDLFSEQAHVDTKNKENAIIELCSGGEAGLFSYPLGNYESIESSLATFYTKYVRNSKSDLNGFKEFNVNKDLNNSQGHYITRTSEDHSEFGYCILIIEYNNHGRKGRIAISYETFDTEHKVQ